MSDLPRTIAEEECARLTPAERYARLLHCLPDDGVQKPTKNVPEGWTINVSVDLTLPDVKVLIEGPDGHGENCSLRDLPVFYAELLAELLALAECRERLCAELERLRSEKGATE